MPGSGGLLAATIAALAGWLTLLAVLRTAFRIAGRRCRAGWDGSPRRRTPGHRVATRARVVAARTAVPATLVDLAARGVAGDRERRPRSADRPVAAGPGTPPSTEPLTAYERMVLDHVRDQAVHGAVACAALTTGPPTRSACVVAQVPDRGRRRRSPAGAVPAALAAADPHRSLRSRPPCRRRSAGCGCCRSCASALRHPRGPWVPVVMAPLVVWSVLVALIGWLAGERDTEPGFEAAGRWLGFRRHLAEHSALDEAEPAAVAVRGRYLAWAAALGLALAPCGRSRWDRSPTRGMEPGGRALAAGADLLPGRPAARAGAASRDTQCSPASPRSPWSSA